MTKRTATIWTRWYKAQRETGLKGPVFYFLEEKTMNPACPYCGKMSDKVSGREIYPHRPDLYAKVFYQCAPCDAYVGCHPGTDKPMGRLANAELRRAKLQAHGAFDFIWKSGLKTRGSAYKWLAKQPGIPKEECHIGMFDVATCRKVVEICANLEIGRTYS